MKTWPSVVTVTGGHGTRGILSVVVKANGDVPAAVKAWCINVLITVYLIFSVLVRIYKENGSGKYQCSYSHHYLFLPLTK